MYMYACVWVGVWVCGSVCGLWICAYTESIEKKHSGKSRNMKTWLTFTWSEVVCANRTIYMHGLAMLTHFHFIFEVSLPILSFVVLSRNTNLSQTFYKSSKMWGLFWNIIPTPITTSITVYTYEIMNVYLLIIYTTKYVEHNHTWLKHIIQESVLQITNFNYTHWYRGYTRYVTIIMTSHK